jgi:hypothetical protein
MAPSRVLWAAAAALAVLPATAATTPAGCGARLAASFVAVPGSAGAGSITYHVKLTNHDAPCRVSGRPGLRLLDAHGDKLPTHVVPDHVGTGTAALITIRRGHSAVADARFSPDIPGPNEGNPCEKTARMIRVTLPSPAHGTVTGPVKPATAVCEHGRIVLGLLHGG